MFWGLTTLPPSMNQLCGILNISQNYRPLQPVMGIVFLLLCINARCKRNSTCRGSVVSKATGYGLHDQEVGVRVPEEINSKHTYTSRMENCGQLQTYQRCENLSLYHTKLLPKNL
jgi:hypothetical protein